MIVPDPGLVVLYDGKSATMNEKTKQINARKIAERIGGIYYRLRKEWLTYDIAKQYTKRAAKLHDNGGQDIGEWRRLRIELQEYCGITEIEAINILRGFTPRIM